MPLPNFLILGPAISGTTSLYHFLRQHPQIYMCPVKEPHFFARGEAETIVYKGPMKSPTFVVGTLPDYLQLFDGITGELAIGEASPNNILPRACERIHAYIPHAKLIAILRQPADRIYAQFIYARHRGWEPHTDLTLALREEANGQREDWNPFLCYQEYALLYPKLANFYRDFQRDQLRIYLYEEWKAQPLVILQDIFKFLGVDPSFVPDLSICHNEVGLNRSGTIQRSLRSPHAIKRLLQSLVPLAWRQRVAHLLRAVNKTAKPPSFDPVLRRQLTGICREDILKTQALIGRDLSHWLV